MRPTLNATIRPRTLRNRSDTVWLKWMADSVSAYPSDFERAALPVGAAS